MKTAPAILIETQAGLDQFLQSVRDATLLAVDTEAASFHRYEDRVYLLQLSTREQSVVVDPLAVADLSGVAAVMVDPAVEIVFHDADYDLRLMRRQFGYAATHLFDTRVAAQLLNEPGIGLAALLAKYFDVTLDKRFQRADWSARPLTPDMLTYAAADTHYLPDLRDLMRDRLIEMGRLSWAEEEFALVEAVEWAEPSDDDPAWLRMKGAKTLKPREAVVLRELHGWRDGLARELDRAPFRIMSNEPMMTIAKEPPRTLEALGTIRGVGKDLLQRRGKDVLAAIERALAIPDEELPKRERRARYVPDPAFDARLDRLKTARNRAAERLELAPGVVAPNAVLEAIARLEPTSVEQLDAIEGMRKWQREEIGEELVRAAKSEK